MKIWINDTNTTTHRLVKLNCESHSDFSYLGDLDDVALCEFLLSVQADMDVEKNRKLLHYYGYLHLFVIHKNKEKNAI